jgi:hypothetical protein
MDATVLNYISGEEIHAGDRVQYKGNYATVVYVNAGGGEDYAPGYEDYIGSEPGVILCDDDGATNSIGIPDASLEFIDRG